MHGLIYVSQARTDFDTEMLTALAQKAAAANASWDITGHLFYEQGRFVQYLEGEASDVNAVMERIEADPRHCILQRLTQKDLLVRRFPSWHMLWLDREQMRSVRLEAILADYLMVMRRTRPSECSISETAWRIVSKLAAHQSRLTAAHRPE